MTDATEDRHQFQATKQQKRKEWNTNNRDKLAEYARAQYHKKVQADPEYRNILAERVRRNRQQRKQVKSEASERNSRNNSN